MSDPRHELGLEGERLAEKHLRKQGLKLVARRYATPVSEIDLILVNNESVGFDYGLKDGDRVAVYPD